MEEEQSISDVAVISKTVKKERCETVSDQEDTKPDRSQSPLKQIKSPKSDESTTPSPARRNKRKMMEPKRRTAPSPACDLSKKEEAESSGSEEDLFDYNSSASSPFTKQENITEHGAASLGYQRSLQDNFDDDCHLSKRARKNYKNMTRERRIEANARERSRVHTISAAFESLRHAVPSYSFNQKLSKLAILRIASSYIMSLGRLANIDYEEETGDSHFAECVDICSGTIHAESKARKRQI